MSLFSVVVPAYNAVATLGETLDAVIAQSFADWECVVVDDGSTDETLDLARSFEARDSRFRVIAQENRGTGGAYNTGVRSAAGEWVTLCSADDLLLPRHLEVMGRAIEEDQDGDIFSCNGYFMRPDGARELVYPLDDDRMPQSWSLEQVLDRCFFSVGACYRRSLFERLGGYDEGVYGEDYDFWLRAMSSGAHHRYVREPLAVHRLSATQKSANLERAFESDIRSIQAVVRTSRLTPSQARAARRAVAHRRRLLGELRNPTALPVRIRRVLRRMRGERS